MNTIDTFSLKNVDPSWVPILKTALNTMDQHYLQQLTHNEWLPGKEAIFNAFSQPLTNVRYVLFGESPYPRKQSANGYAFYDAAVGDLWSPTGLTKQVNRATSLRNFIKMLLLAEALLNHHDLSQEAIAKLDKTGLIKTNDELFSRLLQHGFLLLNASLVLQVTSPEQDAKLWRPFLSSIIQALIQQPSPITWLLFGRIAKNILPFLHHINEEQIIITEHPYNLSFIKKRKILQLFHPMHLLCTHHK